MSLDGIGAPNLMKSRMRSKVLGHLAKAPMTVTELAYAEDKHLSHVSRAISELRAQGLIEPVLELGGERKYRATEEGLALYLSYAKNLH